MFLYPKVEADITTLLVLLGFRNHNPNPSGALFLVFSVFTGLKLSIYPAPVPGYWMFPLVDMVLIVVSLFTLVSVPEGRELKFQ